MENRLDEEVLPENTIDKPLCINVEIPLSSGTNVTILNLYLTKCYIFRGLFYCQSSNSKIFPHHSQDSSLDLTSSDT